MKYFGFEGFLPATPSRRIGDELEERHYLCLFDNIQWLKKIELKIKYHFDGFNQCRAKWRDLTHIGWCMGLILENIQSEKIFDEITRLKARCEAGDQPHQAKGKYLGH